MKKRKLTYHIHDPNPAESTAELLIRLAVTVNRPKVEHAIEEAARNLHKVESETA